MFSATASAATGEKEALDERSPSEQDAHGPISQMQAADATSDTSMAAKNAIARIQAETDMQTLQYASQQLCKTHCLPAHRAEYDALRGQYASVISSDNWEKKVHEDLALQLEAISKAASTSGNEELASEARKSALGIKLTIEKLRTT